MNFCPKCGNPISAGDAFCSNCGMPVPQNDVVTGEQMSSQSANVNNAYTIQNNADTNQDNGDVKKIKNPAIKFLNFFVVASLLTSVLPLFTTMYTLCYGLMALCSIGVLVSGIACIKYSKRATKHKGKARGIVAIVFFIPFTLISVMFFAAFVMYQGPDFLAIYNEYCTSEFADVGSDGSYLSIDTNPSDDGGYTDHDALNAVSNINNALGLPESVIEQMGHTSALDGIQSYSTDELEVRWSYHPDRGLEITYMRK